MKLFSCNLFTWSVPSRISCLWEGDSPQFVDLIIDNAAHARLSIAAGSSAQKRIIEKNIIAAVASRGGYLSPMDEDFPNELILLIDDSRGRANQHHLLRYGPNYAVHINAHHNYFDKDIEFLRSELGSIAIHDEAITMAGDQSACHLNIDEKTFHTQIGERNLLESKPA